MTDVLYLVRRAKDAPVPPPLNKDFLWRYKCYDPLWRLKCSVDSLRAGDFKDFRLCVADVSFVMMRNAIAWAIGEDFEYCHRSSTGLYRRAWNINVGMKLLAEADHILIIDRDVVLPKNYLNYCMERAGEGV